MIDGDRLRFVLSAGRVGSTSLREYLKAVHPELDVAFEPRGSRRTFVLCNAGRQWPALRRVAGRMVLRRKLRDVAAMQDHTARIEINPFVTPFVPELCEHVHRLRVVHVVRDPRAWVRSIMQFRAKGWRRWIIDRIPWTRLVHPLAAEQWGSLGEIEKFAWRWRLHNEQILAARERCHEYLCVRFEDLVSPDAATRETALREVLQVLVPGFDPRSLRIADFGRHNESRGAARPGAGNSQTDDDLRVSEICAPLMAGFGYD